MYNVISRSNCFVLVTHQEEVIEIMARLKDTENNKKHCYIEKKCYVSLRAPQ